MSELLKQVDELRKRMNVSYSDAKEALEYSNGDLVGAMVYLEKNKKAHTNDACTAGNGFFKKVDHLIKKGSSIRCIIYKKDRTIFNLSLNLVILIGLLSLPIIELAAIIAIIALFTGHRFKVEKNTGEGLKINETLNKMSDAVDQMKEKFAETTTEKQN